MRFGHTGIGGCEVGLGDSKIEKRLPEGLVFCVEKNHGFIAIPRPKALLGSLERVLAIENIAALEERESLRHEFPFWFVEFEPDRPPGVRGSQRVVGGRVTAVLERRKAN